KRRTGSRTSTPPHLELPTVNPISQVFGRPLAVLQAAASEELRLAGNEEPLRVRNEEPVPAGLVHRRLTLLRRRNLEAARPETVDLHSRPFSISAQVSKKVCRLRNGPPTSVRRESRKTLKIIPTPIAFRSVSCSFTCIPNRARSSKRRTSW